MDLKNKSTELRKDILKMVYAANSGHIGGSFSIIDILATLYFGEGKNGKFLHYDPKNPNSEDRDYVVMSKGHASPAVYSVLGEAGFFNKDEYFNFRQLGHMLQGHPTKKTPGVEVSGGSLGQGLSVANGIAMGKPNQKVFAILGDGEVQEGQVWEAVMSAAHFNLDNLVAIVDRNEYQIDGHTEDVMKVDHIADKFAAFGWNVLKIDGHDFKEIIEALDAAISVKGKPTVIVAHTSKGKGVSFMENTAAWHGKAPNEEQFEQAMTELEAA